MISLTPSPGSSTAIWLGEVPPESGEFGLLTWVRADGTPVGEVLALIEAPVDRAVHYDGDLRRGVNYTVGGASFLQTFTSVAYGDVV